MKSRSWLILLLLLILTAIDPWNPAQAQDKTLFWERYDVNLTVQRNSEILVEEIQQIEFTSGTFRFGFAAIPLDRLERITDVSVAEVINDRERAYTPNSSSEYGFTTSTNDSNELEITWYFPPTSNSQHTYILRYRVIGGLRFYEEGDQLWWKAIAPDHNFRIRNSRVTVNLPQALSEDQLKIASYGAPVANSHPSGNQVIFEAQNIPADEELEVRVQFPQGVIEGSPASWQAAFDRRQQWGPVVGVLSVALGLLILIGGSVGLYLLWFTRGRDQPAELIPEYITEPPGDQPAAVVGTLIDERAEMKDVIAGILDLAQRGALHIEEKKKEGFLGIGSGLDHIFHLDDEGQAIYPHEKRLLKEIFGKGRERRLRDLRNKFYSVIPALHRELYQEVVKAGFFRSSPATTRQMWGGLAIFGAIASVALSFVLLIFLASYSVAVVCPGLALLVLMVSLIFVSRHMPRKTPAGVEEAAKWLAFKRYLQNIEEHSDLAAVKEKFEQLLPYAVAFGLERRLIKKFAAVNTPAPSWWGPVYGPRPYYHPYGFGRPGGSGEAPAGGPPGPLAGSGGEMPSLAGMSEGIGGSLASMSDSLGNMLSSASSTLTSRPAPKSSGGGGSWSGGGFGGGGGGGGGSRGFG